MSNTSEFGMSNSLTLKSRNPDDVIGLSARSALLLNSNCTTQMCLAFQSNHKRVIRSESAEHAVVSAAELDERSLVAM